MRNCCQKSSIERSKSYQTNGRITICKEMMQVEEHRSKWKRMEMWMPTAMAISHWQMGRIPRIGREEVRTMTSWLDINRVCMRTLSIRQTTWDGTRCSSSRDLVVSTRPYQEMVTIAGSTCRTRWSETQAGAAKADRKQDRSMTKIKYQGIYQAPTPSLRTRRPEND